MKTINFLSIIFLNLFLALSQQVYAAGAVPINAQVKAVPAVNKTVSTVTKSVAAVSKTGATVVKQAPVPCKAAVVQATSIRDCLKSYQLSSEKLFYVALSAINNSNYKIVEIQSHGAKVLFQAESKEFLLSVSKKDSQNSIVKITPANNSYFFPNTIVKRIYNYIDLNSATPIQQII